PEAYAARPTRARRVAAHEPFEDPSLDLWIQSRSPVPDPQQGLLTIERNLDSYRRAGRVDARVVEQVVDHLAQTRGVTDDPDRIVSDQLDRSIRLDRPRALDGVRCDRGEVERLAFERPALIQPGEQQQVVDEHAHARRLGLDVGHGLRQILGPGVGTPAEQLRVPAD